MRDDEIASRAQCFAELADDPVRVFFLPDEMKDEGHAQRCRLREIDGSPQLRVAEDTGRVSQVTLGQDHAGGTLDVSPALREYDRVVVDVHNAGALVVPTDELVQVASRGQAGPDVNELRDTSLSGEELGSVLQEFPVLQCRQWHVRGRSEHEPGRFPVNVGILAATKIVVVHPGDTCDTHINIR